MTLSDETDFTENERLRAALLIARGHPDARNKVIEVKMDAMTERVARAIARRRNKEMEFEPQLSEFLDDARVAIAAIQEPTEVERMTNRIVQLERELERLKAVLEEARQYVSDAGSYEEPGEHQAELLSEIDAVLWCSAAGASHDGP